MECSVHCVLDGTLSLRSYIACYTAARTERDGQLTLAPLPSGAQAGYNGCEDLRPVTTHWAANTSSNHAPHLPRHPRPRRRRMGIGL